MALQTATGQAQCPECLADITLNKVMQNEITQCPGCGAELEDDVTRASYAGPGAPGRRGLG